MPSAFVLLAAGLVLFVLAVLLFRASPRPDVRVGSIWTHGSIAARFGLVVWWVSVLLLLAALVQILRD